MGLQRIGPRVVLVALSVCLSAPAAHAGLEGVWLRVESSDPDAREGSWLEITPAYWSHAVHQRLRHRSPVISHTDGEVVLSVFCNRQRRQVELSGDELVVRYTQTKTKFRPEPLTIVERYRRSDDRPLFLDLAPVPLGDAAVKLPAERVAAVRAELAERRRRDQEVRRVFATPGATPTKQDQDRMRDVDADNTAYLLQLVAEVGWIDAARFGEAAADAAWLIVQHTPDLAFKWTVLQVLEEQRREMGAGDPEFALLWDRTRLWLGEKQRYGSQIFYGPEGMFLAPLEDPAGVDERRAQLGLEPLEEYLERFRARNDGRAIPVRTEF